MIKVVHPIAGAVGIIAIATFWLSTGLSEMFGPQALIVADYADMPRWLTFPLFGIGDRAA